MEAQTADLYRLEDLDDASKTRQLPNSDLAALRTVVDWIKSFVTLPHRDIGRDGPVCPFVPQAIQRKTLWLPSEHVAGGSVAEVVQFVNGYKTQLLKQPIHDAGVNYNSIVIVFTDLSADRRKGLFDDVLKQLAVRSYAEDGLVMGGFYESNETTAIYNRSFRPFTPPVPFLLMRHAVISDWKFFLDNDDWLNRWAHRYGESGIRALAERTTPLAMAGGGRRIPQQMSSGREFHGKMALPLDRGGDAEGRVRAQARITDAILLCLRLQRESSARTWPGCQGRGARGGGARGGVHDTYALVSLT